MAGIATDKITEQIRKAQADAIRKAPSLSAASAENVIKESTRVLKEAQAKKLFLAEQESKKKSQANAVTHTSQGIPAGSYTQQKPTYNEPVDNRTTQQKYDDAKKAYDTYLGSDEHKKALGNVTLMDAISKLFNVTGGPTSDALMGSTSAPTAPQDSKERELNATVERYRKQLQAEEDQRIMDADLKELESWSEEDRNNLNRYIAERDQHAYNSLNPMIGPQFDTYNLNPIVEKYGIDKVRRMAESVQRGKNEETIAKVEEAAQNTANKKPWLGGTLGSIASVGTNLAGAITGPLGYVVEAGQRTGRYSTLDPNNLGNLPSVYGETVRSEVAQNIRGDEESTNWLRKLAALGYQGGMSALDSGARLLASGGSSGISSALAASGAFGNGLRQYSQQGASPTQAAAMALVNAGFEYATEKIPTEKMLTMFKKGNRTGAVREILKQAFLVEPTSEEVNLFSNVAAEAVILGEKSSKSQRVGELIANGMSYEEAQAQVWKELWNEAAQTYAVSAISGGLSSAGATVFGNAVNGNPQTETQPQATPASPVVDEKTRAQQIIEATAADLVKNAPAPTPTEPLTEGQQLVNNAAAELFGVNNEQKNTVPSETVVKVSSAGTALTEENKAKKTLSYMLASNIDKVSDMEPVSRLSGTELNNKGVKLSEQIGAFFKSLGNKILRNGFGEVELGEYGIGGILNHRPINRAKILSLISVPSVIENGRQINYEPNWKGRGYESFTFAAPVTVAGREVYVAAVVDRRPNNKFYLSEMVDSDGNYVRIEESPSGNSKNGLPMGPEDQQGRGYAGPEELSKGNNPTANAEPMSLSNNIISANENGVKGTGAAEQNFSGKAQYQDLLYEGNVQRDRQGDVRPVEVPKTDPYGRNVSETVSNLYGAEITPDRMANTIEELVQEGALGFDRRSNQDALNDAAKVIENSTPAAITKRITGNIANGKIKNGDIEQAMLLYSHYANKNGERAQAQAAELMVDLTTMAHMTGRNLQLFKLLRKMTPEGQVMTIKRAVEQNVESMIRGGKAKDGSRPQINEQLLEDYKNAAAENARAVSAEQKAESEAKMQEIQQAIMADAASQIQSTFKAKWDAWRYMSMLGNGKTQIRNYVGNVLFMPYKAAKDTIGAAFELAMPKDKRTKALGIDKQLLNWAKNDSKTAEVQDALKYTGKLGDDATNAKFADDVKVFDTAALEAVRKFTGDLPAKADLVFKNKYYASSLAGFLKARGYSLQDVQGGKVSDAVMSEARGYAINEAMKATFNDCNSFSDMVSNLRFKDPDTTWKKVANMAGESVLPFRRTPANILVRFAEYSPAGLAKGAWDMATKVSNGKISAAAAVDQIASGLTGTGALVLGYFMAKGIAGVKLTGSGADDDEKRQGHQDYALEFSINGQEYSYTIDWAAPANLPLFVGANLYNAMERNGADTSISALSRIWQVSKGALEPMLKLSCMSSLNDLFETARYAPEGEALYSVVADIATGYFTQGIPALLRQTAQTRQANKQTTFANDPDPTVRELQKLGAQIPFVGAQYQTDKRNEWGEAETTESGWMRALNAYFNPGTLKEISDDPVEKELNRLNEAQVENVSPPTTDKTVSYTDTTGQKHDDMRLTEEQYQTLATTQGQTAKRLLDKLIKSKDYKVMTDSQKAAAVNAVYEYAAEAGKKAALPDYYSNAAGWIGEAEEDPVNSIIRRGTRSILDDAIKNTANALSKGWQVSTAAKQNLDRLYDAYEDMSEDAKKQILDDALSETARYLEIRSQGIDTKQYLDVTKDIKSLQEQEGYSEIRPAQNYTAIAENDSLTETQKTAIMKAYMVDYNPNQKSPNTTELKYEYMLESGYSNKDYALAYDIYSHEEHVGGEGTAERTRARMREELGLSQSEAKALYKLFHGSYKPWKE